MKKLRASKDFRVFVRTVFNAGIAYVWTLLSGLTGEAAILVAGFAIPFLNLLTKYINNKWFNDIGVTKE